MAKEIKSYKFLDIDGMGIFKEELDEVINDSEQSAKTHANGVAATAESNAKEYADEILGQALTWGKF